VLLDTSFLIDLMNGDEEAIEMAREMEQNLDAIGRKPAGRVEPADWQVLLTRVFGIGPSLAGVVAAVLYVL
jgi:hypothetical protein